MILKEQQQHRMAYIPRNDSFICFRSSNPLLSLGLQDGIPSLLSFFSIVSHLVSNTFPRWMWIHNESNSTRVSIYIWVIK